MIRKILYNGLAAAVSTLAGLIRNKIFAAVLSIGLFGILSIGLQSAGLLVTFMALGIPLGVTTLASQLVNKTQEEQVATISRIVVLAIGLAMSFLVLLAIVVANASSALSHAITGNPDYAVPISIILLSAPFMMIETCLYGIMEGMGSLRSIVTFRIVPALLILPVLYAITTRYQLTGAAAGMMANEILLCAVAVVLLRRFIRLNRDALQVRSVFLSILKVAVLSFAVGTSGLAVDFIVKRYVLGVLGEVDNGIVQCVAKVTDLYPSIALAWLTMHLFPAVASSEPPAAARIVERTTVIAVTIIVPVVLLLFAFRPLILELIYKKEFVLATDYFGAMLVTGIPRVYSWVLGVGLLAVGLRREWFYSALIMTAIYLAGTWVGFYAGFGIYALPLTLGIGLALQSAYSLAVYSRKGFLFGKAFRAQSAIMALLTLLVLAAVYSAYFLVLAAIVYLIFLIRYKLIDEVKEKIYGILQKT